MRTWLRHVRGAMGVGLGWAVAWAIVGLLIGVASSLLPGLPWNSVLDVFDAPLPALAIPGFVGGVFFSVVLGIVERRRTFAELSLPRFAAWGAVGGLLLSLLPAALVAVGLASVAHGGAGLWQLTAVVAGPLTLLSAVSASASLLLARKAERRGLPEGTDTVTELESP